MKLSVQYVTETGTQRIPSAKVLVDGIEREIKRGDKVGNYRVMTITTIFHDYGNGFIQLHDIRKPLTPNVPFYMLSFTKVNRGETVELN